MTQEEFISKRSELQDAMANLLHEYLTTNQPYAIGTKLTIENRDGSTVEGIVRKYIINGWDEVVPELAKVNKDGTPHKSAQVYAWRKGKVLEVVPPKQD